jgi:hypothetical protein
MTPADVICVADKILCRKFPVTRQYPLVYPANDFHAAFAAIEKCICSYNKPIWIDVQRVLRTFLTSAA